MTASMRQTEATSSLCIWRDRFVFTASEFHADQSCRPSNTILVGADNDLVLNALGREHRGHAMLVKANIEREITLLKGGLYSLNLDPTHPLCRFLRIELQGDRGIVDLSDKISSDIRASIRHRVASTDANCQEDFRLSQKLIDAAFPDSRNLQPIDSRVDLVASWLWTRIPKKIDLNFLADLCGLSQSRLAHIFTEQLGISIRQYLLWVKMRKAAELFVKDQSLADVAHEIGFSDSAHLSRTFSRYFALKPSYLANHSTVRVRVCASNLDAQ